MDTSSGDLLYIDKYQPTSLNELKFNREVTSILKNLAVCDDIPHIIVQGPPGCGKKTRVLTFLYERFGYFTSTMSSMDIQISSKNKKKKQVKVIHSPHHFQIDPSIHEVHDRAVIKAVVQDIVQYNLVTNSRKKVQTQRDKVKDNIRSDTYRIIVFENLDKLTQEAQQSLRRTLEVNIQTCRFIFIATNLADVISPLQSRCLILKVSAPPYSDIYKHLKSICVSENIKFNTRGLSALTNFTNRNLKKSMIFLQSIVTKWPLELLKKSPDFKLIDKTYEVSYNIIKDQIEGTDIDKVNGNTRENICDLLIYCMTPCEIVLRIYDLYIKYINRMMKKYHDIDFIVFVKQLNKVTSDYCSTLTRSHQPVWHIEALCMEIMQISKFINEATATKILSHNI